MSRTFPPVTMNPPGYLGDDDSLGGPSQRRSTRSSALRGRGRSIFRGPSLNSSPVTPYPMYLPSHSPDWDGLGDLGFAPVAALSVASGAKKAVTSIFGHPKDAGRHASNAEAYRLAQAGDGNAFLFLKGRSGRYGTVNVGPIPSLNFPGGPVAGWATSKEKNDANNKYNALKSKFEARSATGAPMAAPGAPSMQAQADIYNTSEIAPGGALPNTNTVASRVANAASAISAFADTVAQATAPNVDAPRGLPESGGVPAGSGSASAPSQASVFGLSPAMLLAGAVGFYLLRGRKRGRR